MHPQFTYDNQGNTIGVFLSIEDWNFIKEKHPDIDLPDQLPQWQKDILDNRRALANQPEELIPMDDFIKLVEGDEAI